MVSDIDEKNLDFAKRNISQNGLTTRVRPLLTTTANPLFPLDAFKFERCADVHRDYTESY